MNDVATASTAAVSIGRRQRANQKRLLQAAIHATDIRRFFAPIKVNTTNEVLLSHSCLCIFLNIYNTGSSLFLHINYSN